MPPDSQTLLLDSLPDGLVLIGGDGRVAFVNRAAEELLGVRREGVVGQAASTEALRAPAEWLESCRAAREGRTPARLAEVPGGRGTPAPRLAGEARPSPGGGVAMVFREVRGGEAAGDARVDELVERNAELKLARDELAQRNAELAEATQAKDRFMATMSHEMRTPLNAVLGYVELLNLGVAGELGEAQHGYLDRIGASGRALLELINDVLDFTRADVGKLALELRPLRLAAVAEEAAALVETHAQQKRIPLRIEPPPASLPLVMGDFRRVRQILTNLLTNAVKFTHDGSITVSFGQPDAEHASVTVADTGIGIPPEKLRHVFAEFYQGDSDLTREYGGAGLGLAISQRLARLQGGQITVESEEGRGSRFTLTLPAASAEALARGGAGSHAVAEDGAAGPPLGEPAVVVVFGKDDEGLARLRQSLGSGVRLVGATVPANVAEVARRERAVLVVVDVAWQGGVGWQAAHEVREDPALDDVAVLLLPCIPEAEEGVSGALDLGWVAVVPKPFSSGQLARMVDRVARRGAPAEGEAPAARDLLVVDDDPDARDIAAQILSATGAEVRSAQDGEAGLAEMRRRAPDVAVIDLMMPVLDGFGVLAAMRADPALHDIPVVVLTAKDLSEAERRFLSRTAETVLEKGVHSLSDVAALILQAARRRSPPAARAG